MNRIISRLINYLTVNIPEIGKGATILLWTDSQAYEVIEVSDDKKECTLQRYIPEKIDDKTYKFKELSDEKIRLVKEKGIWKYNSRKVNVLFGIKEEHCSFSFI